MQIAPIAITGALFGLSAGITYALIYAILHTPLVSMFVDPPNARKVHTIPIPRIGGLAITGSVMLMLLLWNILSTTPFFPPIEFHFSCAILLSAVILGVFGFFDDSKFVNMKVRHKLLAVILLAVATVYLFGIHPGEIALFNIVVVPEFWSKIIAVLWIIGLVNAFNLVDGLDGLAGTVTVVSFAGIFILGQLSGNPEAAIFSLVTAGATVGFLFHNTPPAKIFMGDTGSLFLGFTIALLTLHIAPGVPHGKVPLVLPLLAGIPVLEVFVTIVRRYFRANELNHSLKTVVKFIVTADCNHIHHRFLFRGFSHLETCVLVGVLAATMVAGAIAVYLSPVWLSVMVALYLILPVSVALYRLGFGGRFRVALNLGKSNSGDYDKPEFIGVIDSDGKLYEYLRRQRTNGYVFVPLSSQKDLPAIAGQLRAAVVRNTSVLTEMAARVAMELSTIHGFSRVPFDGSSRESLKIISNLRTSAEELEGIQKIVKGFTSSME